MKLAWNFEEMDLMKRASQPVQGLKPLSEMLTLSVCVKTGKDRRWPIPNLHLDKKHFSEIFLLAQIPKEFARRWPIPNLHFL
jgi:hypothetical protein